MLHTLGRRAAAADPASMLLECHGRIRRFLETARRLAAAEETPAPEVAEAAEAVRRYFVSAYPLHVRDEEELIVPRLRGTDPAVDAALAAMEREHGDHELPVSRLIATCRLLADDPGRLPALRGELAAIVADLTASLGPHLGREEAVILPALQRLPAADQARLLAEMRERR